MLTLTNSVWCRG